MSVEKHPKIENAWIIRWYPEGRKGQRKKQTVYDVDESQARLVEQSLRRRREGGIKNAANPLIKDVLPDWLAWMHLHRSPKTVESIGWALKHLEPHFGHLTVPQINEAVINQYKHKRKGTPRSCNLEIDYLKSMISWMVERKLCDPLPFKIERLPYQRPLPRIPSSDDLWKWMDNVTNDGPKGPDGKRQEGPKKAVLWIMVRAGLRYAEASTLRWENIDWNQGLIYYTAKRNQQRISVLPQEAREILEPLRQSEGWVSPNPKTDAPYTNMKTLFKTASEKSGVKIKGPHTLRHICGTYTLSATGDLRLVQQTLGHSQIRTTELYTQIDLDRMRQGQKQTEVYTRRGGPGKTEGK